MDDYLCKEPFPYTRSNDVNVLNLETMLKVSYHIIYLNLDTDESFERYTTRWKPYFIMSAIS